MVIFIQRRILYYLIIFYLFNIYFIKVNPIEVKTDPSLKGDLAVEQVSQKLPTRKHVGFSWEY